ncbi:MAG: hypothetical protein IJ310_03475 [Clostridia bacterium]|nr:hypothetical protein [Clostridia bacterium]
MDKELFEKLLKGYQSDLAQLDEIKEENAEYYSSLSDEDLVDVIAGDMADVYNDATEQGATIGEVPTRE